MENLTKRYAFLAENEIFDIMPMKGNYEDPSFLRWSNGFSNEPKLIDISGVSGVSIGSVWDGEGFDSSSVPEDTFVYEINPGRQIYAVIDKENIVFMIMDCTESLPMLKDAFEAAVSTGNVVPMDISDFPTDVSYGWIWNGESFLPPDES
jgi:hypothetical protein